MKQFTPPELPKALALTGFLALSAVAAAPAQSVVLDFQSLEINNGSLFNPVGTSYTEKGFTVTSVVGLYGLERAGTNAFNYPGSTALFSDDVDALTRLTQVGGGTFDLSSMDLTAFITDSLTANFTGTKADNSTVTRSFTTDAIQNTFETVNFTGFTDLVRVDWTQSGSYIQFDNINVSASSTAVPEPFTVLGTLFGMGSSIALKRKLAKEQRDREDI